MSRAFLLRTSVRAMALSIALLGLATPARAADSVSLGSAPLTSVAGDPGIDHTMLDLKASPCADFYRFACGGWVDSHPIPPDETSWRVDQLLGDQTLEKLRRIMERAAVVPTDDTKKIGDFYAACMDEEHIEMLNLAPIKPEMDRIKQLNSKDQLPALLAHLHSIGAGGLFDFYVAQDSKDAETELAGVDASGLGLPDRSYYLKTDPESANLRNEYTAHVARMLNFARVPAANAQADSIAVTAFETKMATAMLDRVARRDPQRIYHKMSLDDLQKLTPNFNWTAYLKELGAPPLPAIDVTEPDFIQAEDKMIAEASLSDLRAYLRWHLIRAKAEWLPKRFVAEDFQFSARLSGAADIKPRWKRCVMAADYMLMDDLGRAYVADAFLPEAKQRTEAMVDAIQAAFKDDLETLDWMGPETRARALAKLALMRRKVGYPDKWRDYSTLAIAPDDALGNAERAARYELAYNLAKIGKPVDHGEWMISASTVNAYYDSSMNDVNLPAGQLQPPFFSPDFDDAVNFGATGGGTVGHEMTHGFDDEGRQYDGHGNLVDWWTKQDAARFAERAKCVVDQFSAYPVAPGGPNIDGKLTLGENVADLGGVRLGYMALMKALAGKPEAKTGGFTPVQRYFVGYAQSWCGSTRPETAKMHATTDPHSPPEYRVNGVVSDLPEFRRAFACKPGDKMAPARMCRVW